ncbi:MAG TPA: hypothetical protein VKA15_09785 [Isosphaeraceae bacterium]|nr:hypothetical protein [Isosphaeraceae bacterium]
MTAGGSADGDRRGEGLEPTAVNAPGHIGPIRRRIKSGRAPLAV